MLPNFRLSFILLLVIAALIGCSGPAVDPSSTDDVASGSDDDGSIIGNDDRPPSLDQGGPGDAPTGDDTPADSEPGDVPEAASVCGDGLAVAGETCDGADVAGASCELLGFAGGELTCRSGCDGFRDSGCEAMVATPIAALGETLPLGGGFDGNDPLWNRPTADCSAGTDGGHVFDSYALVNNTERAQRVVVTAAWGEGNDGFLHAFLPGADLRDVAGCLSGNDDLDGMDTSGLGGIDLPAGGELMIVASTYGPGVAFGAYALSVATIDPATVEDPVVTDPVVTDPVVTDPVVTDPDSLCGNAAVDDGEVCDGANVGDATCSAAGFSSGIVACASTCGAVVNHCYTAATTDTPAVGVVAIGAPGDRVHLDGNISVVDATFVRTAADCSTAGTRATYEVVRIANQTGSAQQLTATASFSEGGVGSLAVYAEGFDPTVPATDCRASGGDEDGAPASVLTGVTIADGELLTLVVSSSSDAAGAYTVDIDTAAAPAAPTLAIGALGTSTQLTGDLSAAATWNRVGQDCEVTASGGQRFVAHRIENTSDARQYVSLTAHWDADGFLAVFSEDFAPDAPSASCIDADDDHSFNAVPGADMFGSHVSGVVVEAGEALVVVASSYAATTSVGAYSIDVTTETSDGAAVIQLATDSGTHTTAGTVHETSPILLGLDGDRFFSAHIVRNHGNHEHGVELTATWADGEDGVLDVYLYDPLAAGGLGLLIATNDDFEGTAQSHISGDDLRLVGFGPLVVVATSYWPGEVIGTYALDVTTTD